MPLSAAEQLAGGGTSRSDEIDYILNQTKTWEGSKFSLDCETIGGAMRWTVGVVWGEVSVEVTHSDRRMALGMLAQALATEGLQPAAYMGPGFDQDGNPNDQHRSGFEDDDVPF